MKDYELIIRNIRYYKSKACDYIRGRCDKCEAAYEYHGRPYCQFDTVIRFIEWDNHYNT